jgi:hypothetical protein
VKQSRLNNFLKKSFSPRAPGSVVIPVYVHVITNADGTQGNITRAVVEEQIKVLNDAFAGRDPHGGIATPFVFDLRDVDWTANEVWFGMKYNENNPTNDEVQAKQTLNKGDSSTLNIYTVGLISRPFGWARYPWELSKKVDGIVIGFPTVPGGTAHDYNLGDTAVHETGHWLGLYHTFQNGCDGEGDEVEDTPAEGTPAYGCPPPTDTCSLIPGYDPIHNFMDYAYDSCMYEFTLGQVNRMDAMHFEHRTTHGRPPS